MKYMKSKYDFYKLLATFIFIMLPWLFALIYNVYYKKDPYQAKIMVQNYNTDTLTGADHSKFKELQKDFKSPQEVTETCLSCHNNRGKEFMHTEHFQWLKKDSIPGRGNFEMGKRNILNNFCIGINSNEQLCSMCHAGYGYGNKNFDFTNQDNEDCLICHDNTGTYKKSNPCAGPNLPGAGNPSPGVNLSAVAQHVGFPKRNNCLSCHGVGGGGNNVKHGDLEMALNKCTRDIDVHMASKDAKDNNMSCQKCHRTTNHNIKGELAMVSSSPKNGISCVDCHTDHPHTDKLLNNHFRQVACQTCHIPTYAKVNPTKIYWDWSSAGKLKNGKTLQYEKEITADDTICKSGDYILAEDLPNLKSRDNFENVKLEYNGKHGTAVFANNLKPEYIWSNGYFDHQFISDKITDTIHPLILNKPFGSYKDNRYPSDKKHPSKIIPVKIMRGKQIYDKGNMNLIQPKLAGKIKGSGAYWVDFDWQASASEGMKYLNLPYSGKYSFIETESIWPINHMVSPKEKSLTCEECHSHNSRLAALTGFYLPGRDRSVIVDKGGVILIILALIAVLIHAIIRIINRKKTTH
ncbi:MAG: tetrathionate reductase family octaheme c-type cytochrome [Chlorobi bacterium]|nr:tetrathionate reductase family octaheme c-type cytochrome [Chlorobiota bacterium]